MLFITKLKKRPYLLLLGLFILPYYMYGQQSLEANKYANQSVLSASPASTSFLVVKNTPISKFTGTPDIMVPLHAVTYKDLSIDLSLQYHQAIGSKPDAFPGSTGNGWLLNHGGVITRVSRGATGADFPSNISVPVNFNPTQPSDWSSQANLDYFRQTQTYFYNNNGRYDEYAYSFGGSSGKFYIDHTDAFHIKTTQGEDIKVESSPSLDTKVFTMPTEPQVATSCTTTPYTNLLSQRKLIYQFVLTDSRGIKYTFGGTDESIEFTRPGMGHGVFDLNNQNTLPTSWYLTSVTSPNGYTIALNYKRDKFYITNEIAVSDKIVLSDKINSPNSWADSDNSPKGKVIRSTLYHPCYLDEIVTPSSKVKFNWSKASAQLGYTVTADCMNPTDANSQIYFYAYPEIKDAPLTNRFPNKLDSIVVFANGATRRKALEFTYTNSTATRLKLLSVITKGDGESLPPYSFEYNTAVPLPDYLSFKTDDYGFYNNKNLYITSTDPIYYYNLFSNATDRQAYLDSRKPDINYTQAEILKKVTYSTGGYTEYEYENNEYGRVAKYWPASVLENSNGNQYTGGLRIKRITDYDYTNHKAREKQYFYRKNYATSGTGSSGILSDEPIHWAYFSGAVTPPLKYVGTSDAPRFTGTMTYTQYSTDPINSVRYNKGSHITYSEVTELNLDGSYSTYKFKNYDNGFHDRPAESYSMDNANVGDFYKMDEMNSLEIERGQPLSEEHYSSSNTLKRSIINTYNDDVARFDNNVRRLKLNLNPIFSVNYPSLRYSASLIYTYYPYLKTSTITSYDQGNSVVNTTTNTFNIQNRLLASQSSFNSKGQAVIVSNKYAPDYPADAVNLAMTTSHIIAPVIESTTSVAANQVSLIHNTYYSPFTGVYVPQDVQVKNGTNPIEVRQNFTAYDAKGNLMEQQKPSDVKESYLWGYNNQYVVAKVLGSDITTVKSFIDQTILDNAVSSSDATVRTELNKIRSGLATSNPAAQVTTYTYNDLRGITSVTDPAGKTLLSGYDKMDRLSSQNNLSGSVRASYCYNYAGQAVPCTALAPTGSIAASTLALIAEDPPLPVTLTDFSAVKSEQSALLSWKTTKETNSDRFEIERSIDGKTWLKLGSILAQGESDGDQQYTFMDKLPVNGGPSHGENLYRLQMIDSDGTYAYSRIRSLIFGTDSKVSIYPNPITIGENINLLIDDISTVLNIKIYDNKGTLVQQSTPARKIAAANLSAGLYMVQVTYTDGSISTHRVVKQ
ncbi:T9SS type A sorting domain-containing protein [Dyadobacter frigoris]|uniref:T9SS type A sorting domain-containing protein n=1 Tax=Dyadobacter frigoris TaxID=2576211 RepID=A0A4V6BIJ5_9BACT|nr:T9SS type A sorting domain-containing protein [Dyadobacter frigoris]TKT88613.1 T9SS type A sorting domain-containing protein [Dyadobacter frigoris]